MPATDSPCRALVYLGACLLLGGAAVLAQADTQVTGHWEGAVLIDPAEFEIDLLLDIEESADRKLLGRISLPEQNVKLHPLAELSVDSGKISFVYDDGKNRSVFSGQISADGRTITGSLAEAGKSFPFVLERRSGPPAGAVAQPALRRLSRGGEEFKELFTKDAGHVRLVMIFSPTCNACRNSARLVRRYVLEKIDDPGLRAYVVWEPVYPSDDEAAAAKVAASLPDPRVTHFWADHRFAGSAFQDAVGPTTSPVWDVVLVFGGQKLWRTTELVPAPDSFMHKMTGDELPKERRLNGAKLADEVRALLKGSGGVVAEAGRDR